MLLPDYLDSLPYSVVTLFRQVEEDILEDMARRIVKTESITDTAQWQAWRLEQLGETRQTIRYHLQRLTGKTQGELNALFQAAGGQALYYDDQIYRAAGLTPGKVNDSPALLNLLRAGARQTQKTFQNLTQTTANTATQQFERALDRAWLQISSGAFDYQTTIRRAIKDLALAGLQSITYPTGHTDALDVAVRRAVLTGVNRTAARLSEARAEEMGCDLVETTAHQGARPEHVRWQGKVFSRSGKSRKYPDFVRSTGYGTGPGLCGWNCRHSFFPYFEGLSESAYPRSKLREYEEKTVRYNGKTLSYYDATQQQRAIERKIRRWKREYLMLDAAGMDTTQASVKLAQWRAAERDFCRQTGLDRDGFRSQTEGFGRSQAAKAINQGRSDVFTLYKMSDLPSEEKQKTFFETKFPIQDNTQSVVEAIELAKLAGIHTVDFSLLRNGQGVRPFLEQLIQLNKQYGIMFSRIEAVELPFGDLAQMTPSYVLQINLKYFNSKERIEYCIKEFIKKKVLPKAADIRYIATHEWGHFVSIDQLRDSKSKVITIFRRSSPKDFVSENAAINIYEYAADCIACKLLGIPCKNADKVVELLLK